ncbi:uncharacterized protein [Fopius arisanus]|uniref:Uncharacterized protein n=1 Tax=Fopius arisanus TaxID=64838 RepID=A0A9R1TPN5_9HYME|nr:PREDICTED: uncharacterized protein LOC105272592 [Fopius arisanus]
MPSPPTKFTTSKAIDHFNAGATLMKITGYVDCIEGIKELPNSPSKWLYKCILNNNDQRRVRILFWGDDACKYNTEISMYQILKITGGVIKEANPTYYRSGDTVGKKEFQFGRGSTLEILGIFDIVNDASGSKKEAITFARIEMKDVCTAKSPVIVSGWLKEHFRSIITANGASYGCAMICTDVHRITVHVTTFVPKPEFVEGMKIDVQGSIERRADAFFFNVKSMEQITAVPFAPVMTEDEMDDAVESPPLTPKRDADDCSQNGTEKRQKLD